MKNITFEEWQHNDDVCRKLEKQIANLKSERYIDWHEVDRLSREYDKSEKIVLKYRCQQTKKAIKLALKKLNVAMDGLKRKSERDGQKAIAEAKCSSDERLSALIDEYGDSTFDELHEAYGYELLSDEDFDFLSDRLENIKDVERTMDAVQEQSPEIRALKMLLEFSKMLHERYEDNEEELKKLRS